MGNYATYTEVRTHKVAGEVVDLVAFSDAEITAEIAIVEEFIELFTNDWFYAQTKTVVYDGGDYYRLFFPPEIVAPAISITSVEELDDDGTTVLTTYTEDEDFKVQEHYLDMLRTADTLRRVTKTSRFPKGKSNVKVVGSFGRSTVPAAIKRATLLWTLENLIPGSSGMATPDVIQAVWPDFTVTYKRSGNETDFSTGYLELDRLLARYINFVDMFLGATDGMTPADYNPWRED